MKITEKQLRQIINEELSSVHEGWLGDKWDEHIANTAKEFAQDKMVDPVLDRVESALTDYLRNNAESLADQIVPNIRFDGDILEKFAKNILTKTLKLKSEEIANCTRGLVDPEIIDSAKQDIS